MRKQIVLILFLLVTVCCNAQKLNIGPTLGVNYSKISDTNSKLGYQVGVQGIYTLSSKPNSFIVESGLFLAAKKWESDERQVKVDDYIILKKDASSPYYMYLPVFLGYQLSLNDKVKFKVSAGPYFDYGLFGNNSEISYKDGNQVGCLKYKVFATPLKRFDIGLGAKVGMLFQERYQLSIGFDKGLNGAYGDRKWNSFNLGLGVFL